ncbi:hypothetical protein [Candidatus Aalborgicola defluviihabitans]|uniref:hypothetical protein n=1 Tax=Candidatus Aalborgicola defluviihabitans TaxID=3386187 RepID=UPI001EB718AA|nr:hypothetical protein [Burkholderiales bacterium]
MKTHLASNVSLISIQGIQLQVEHIAAPALATGRAPIVFLHEGLGSVAMWAQLAASGLQGHRARRLGLLPPGLRRL